MITKSERPDIKEGEWVTYYRGRETMSNGSIFNIHYCLYEGEECIESVDILDGKRIFNVSPGNISR